MKKRSLLAVVSGWVLIVTANVISYGCGEGSSSALEPLLLEGPEAVQAVRAARESDVRIHGTSLEDLDWPPVFFVDGQRVEEADLEFLDHRIDLIKSIRVFKGDRARATFGPDVGDHVFEITLKETLESLGAKPDSAG